MSVYIPQSLSTIFQGIASATKEEADIILLHVEVGFSPHSTEYESIARLPALENRLLIILGNKQERNLIPKGLKHIAYCCLENRRDVEKLFLLFQTSEAQSFGGTGFNKVLRKVERQLLGKKEHEDDDWDLDEDAKEEWSPQTSTELARMATPLLSSPVAGTFELVITHDQAASMSTKCLLEIQSVISHELSKRAKSCIQLIKEWTDKNRRRRCIFSFKIIEEHTMSGVVIVNDENGHTYHKLLEYKCTVPDRKGKIELKRPLKHQLAEYAWKEFINLRQMPAGEEPSEKKEVKEDEWKLDIEEDE